MQTNDFSRNPELLKRISEGDESATNELICANMGLVRSIANRFQATGSTAAATTTDATLKTSCRSERSA